MVAMSPCITFLLKSLTAQNTVKGNLNEKGNIFSLMPQRNMTTSIPQLSNHANFQNLSPIILNSIILIKHG